MLETGPITISSSSKGDHFNEIDFQLLLMFSQLCSASYVQPVMTRQ